MSLDAIRAVVALRARGELPGAGQLAVLLCVADKMRRDDGHTVTIGFRRLAEFVGVSKSTVSAALMAGQVAGLFEVVTEGVGTRASTYRLVVVDNPASGTEEDRYDPVDKSLAVLNGTAAVPRSTASGTEEYQLQERDLTPGYAHAHAHAHAHAREAADADDRTARNSERSSAYGNVPRRQWPTLVAEFAEQTFAEDFDARDAAMTRWPHDPDLRAQAVAAWQAKGEG